MAIVAGGTELVMNDDAGEHWVKFEVCGNLTTLQKRTDEFISILKETFVTVTIQKSRSIGCFDVEVWIPNLHEVDDVICFANATSCFEDLEAKYVCEALILSNWHLTNQF